VAAGTTEATNIGLIYGCASAFVAAWEIAAGRQRPAWRLLLGIAACLAGVVLILTKGRPDVVRDLTFTPGDLWAAAGMLVFVGYTVAMRRVPAALTAMPQFAVMCAGATLALQPFALDEASVGGLPTIDETTLVWLAVVVLATGIGAFLGYNISLARNGPVLTSASLTLTPAFAAAQAMALIGEQLAWYHGGHRPRRRRPDPDQPRPGATMTCHLEFRVIGDVGWVSAGSDMPVERKVAPRNPTHACRENVGLRAD
jgi:drug/metabolite transporter (DMT)-like permease